MPRFSTTNLTGPMSFSSEFEQFDPLTGYVPAHPFSYLPDIARRARSILNGRTVEWVEKAAKRIVREIDGYFEDLKSQAVYELTSKFHSDPETYAEFFEWDGGTLGNGRWLYKNTMDEELDIPTAQNSSEVEALKTIIENRDSHFFLAPGAPVPPPVHWPEGRTDELFAVLALRSLAYALLWSKSKTLPINLSIAGSFAIEATDAVCYAEHLREIDWLEQRHSKQLHELTLGQDARTAAIVDSLRRAWAAEQVAHELERRSVRAERLSMARHKDTHHARDLVCTEWAKNTDAFPSAEKAGIHYASWIVEAGHLKSIEPRTVTRWIREHAKLIGRRLR